MPTIAEIFKTMDYGLSPESPSVATQWLASHQHRFDLFINGEWVAPSSGQYTPVINPANAQELAQVAQANTADIDQAYHAARSAFESWSRLDGHVRARYLYQIARQVQKHQRLLAVVESLNNGKSIRESRDLDVPLVARHFYHHAGWAQLQSTELASYQPLGVVGQIIPWNFPLLMLAWKIAPALAMGNTVVIKPAPYTPLTALLFAEILAEAGLPAGVVNIVPGGDEAGVAITSHQGFDKIAFTGSTEVGKIIRRATAGRGQKLSLELGGKSPFVIFDDADQDSAVEGLVDAIWFNQGQVCCAGSRMLVQESIADGFFEKVRRRMDQLRVGDSLDKGVDLGAVVAPIQQQTIQKWVQIGLSEGAELYQPACELPASGYYFPPTLLTHVAPSSTVAQEEIFGPVLVGMTFRTVKEAIELANNTRYGLAASVWSETIGRALYVAQKIKAGSVWVNCTNQFDAASGFGGYRESGYGREGGREGLFEYLRHVAEPHSRLEPRELNPHWGKHNGGIPAVIHPTASPQASLPRIDRTPKLYIGGKQQRPDGNYTQAVLDPNGHVIGQVGDGNRKDIRDAVEAALKAQGWAEKSGHARAQILYYIAENLDARRDEFTQRLVSMCGYPEEVARLEVETSISRWFTYGAYADKFGGTIQETPLRGVTMAVMEAIGVIGIVCPNDAPLLGMVSLVAPAIARGNTVIVIPSSSYPLSATDFYQVLDTSDVPDGVINIITGNQAHLTKTLVEHDAVDALWYFGDVEGSQQVEFRSASNMKRTWVSNGNGRDWYDPQQGAGETFLRHATQVKNIWIPNGD